MSTNKLVKFTGCKILCDHKLVVDDLWVENGKIINPEKVFFEEQRKPDIQFDCHNSIISPGYIDLQLNGALGCDFSIPTPTFREDIQRVCKFVLNHGVTSFCPTIVTSPSDLYKQSIPYFTKSDGSSDGAGILGLHIEGPFINPEKCGAHPTDLIRPIKNGFQDLIEMYGTLDNAAILTLAPEIPNALPVIEELVKRGITVSLGHSTANLRQGELGVHSGATFITHLFNAMLPFHHRDPHLVGLLSSSKIPPGKTVYYGLIADGIHTDPAALRIAHRTHPKGLVLVTDAISAMGLSAGTYNLGQQKVEIKNNRAVLAGTDTLSGSIATLDQCVKFIRKASECTTVEALEAATLHPAELLNITDRKGTLEFNTDADFLILDDDLNVHATYIGGQQVWCSENVHKHLTVRDDPYKDY